MPRQTSSARRYAEAAFDLAVRDKAVPEWLEQLERAAELSRDERLDRLLDNPGVPVPQRLDVLARALGSGTPAAVLNLLGLLLRRGRIKSLPQVAVEFRGLYLRQEGITPATVTTALALEADELRAIGERLERQTGGRVELSTEVDAAILGGLIVRLGDRLIDGSVRGRLERLRARLISGAI
jgi:F-type H+-transporting ATPase subunit delta